MSGFFNKTDANIHRFNVWGRKHRAWRAIIYIVAFCSFWPAIAAYYLARFLKRKIGQPIGKPLAAALIGFGILINISWLASASSSPQTTTQTPQVASQQKVEQKPEPSPSKEPEKVELYKIVSVTDGDTLKVDLNGTTETVRLIGIDTPETVDPRTTVQCFGQEASDYAKSLLTGKSVKLEADSSQGERDKYNRLLRYIILEDGTNINKKMITDGYAYEYTYNTPYKYQSEFKVAQQDATNASRGLWAANTCAGQRTKSQAATSTAPVTDQSSAAANCNIKGNISSDDEKIYHVPGGKYYDKTKIDTSKGERYFCSEAEAQAAGWRASKV